MDVVSLGMVAVVGGVALAPSVPGTATQAAGLLLGLLALAGMARGARRAWLASGWLVAAALAVGGLASRSVPEGPRLDGVVQLQGVRVGAPLGRSADVALGRPGESLGGRVRVRFPARPPPAGTVVLVFGHAGPVRPALPGAPDPVRAARLSGIASEVVAIRATSVPPPRAPPAISDPTGMLTALVTGDRSRLDPALVARLRRTGTAHLLAISGFHVSVVAGLLAAGALLGHRSLAVVWPAGGPPWTPAVVGLLAATGYASTAGAPLSAQRATLVLGLVALGRLMGRRPRLLPLLGLVAAAVAVGDPAAIATPGYQLSFGAVAGLATFGSRIEGLLPPDLPGWVRWTGRSVAASTAATLGTLPAAAWWFQQLAPFTVLANLLAVPLVGGIVVPAAGLSMLLPDPLSGLAAGLGTIVVRTIYVLLAPFDVPPLSPAVGPGGALLLALALGLGVRRPVTGGLCGLVVLTWPAPRADGWRFVFLDVGQGDAIYVEHPDGTRWLVDGGRPSRAVLHWLRRQGIRHLDAVVVTHTDLDHLGGAVPVIAELSVSEVWAHTTPASLTLPCARAGVPLVRPPGGLWPPAGAPPVRGNASSVVLSAGPLLLLGDVSGGIEERLVEDGLGAHRLLKVAHHGSGSSTTPSLLGAVRPEHAFIGVGRGNRYGHPAPATLARLEAENVRVWRTDHHGTIEVRVGDGIDEPVRVEAVSDGGPRRLLGIPRGATTAPHRGASDP